ncbi:MAG: hypothetical protein OWQ56_09350 [Acidithiobacillus caldus]|nr:hypothetical protein [Acidithiobacillus caldus]
MSVALAISQEAVLDDLDRYFGECFATQPQVAPPPKEDSFRMEDFQEYPASSKGSALEADAPGEAESISEREVYAARTNSDMLYHLWLRLEPSVRQRMRKVQRVQKHTQLDDLMQEAFEAFHRAIHAYDGSSAGAFVAYYRRYALHTRIRNFSAHDRVIPVPHDTRGSRQSWHRVSESTIQARLQAQDLSWPDAAPTNAQGWETFESEEDMEEQVVNRIDTELFRYKILCLPRRWRDLLLLSQRYEITHIAELTNMHVTDVQETINLAMNILRIFSKERFWVGRSEADYRAEWDALSAEGGD